MSPNDGEDVSTSVLAAGAWLRSVRGTPSPQTHYSFFEDDLRKEVEGLAQHPFVARRVERPMNALGRGFIVARNPCSSPFVGLDR